MDDFRGEICLLEGEYVAKCVSQDFGNNTLTFEIETDGKTFTRQGDYGVEIYEQGELTFEDVKHLLPRVNKEK